MSLEVTNGDLFYDLLLNGIIPTDHDYSRRVYGWIKWNILVKIHLSCQEKEWLVEYTNYFYCRITTLWKENKSIIIQDDPFLKQVISANESPKHSCSKCRNGNMNIIPNQVIKLIVQINFISSLSSFNYFDYRNQIGSREIKCLHPFKALKLSLT